MVDLGLANIGFNVAYTQIGYPTDYIWNQIVSLSWLEAVFAISFGVVYLLYGWRVFKVLTVVASGLFGLFVGIEIGSFLGSTQMQLWAGIAGLVVLAVVSVLLMRYAVSFLGGIAGAILVAGLWHSLSVSREYIWTGAVAGFIGGFLISFIIFKFAVMLFTSLGGSVFMVVGLLELANIYESNLEPPTQHIHDWVYTYNWFLPICFTLPTVIGMYLQNRFHKQPDKWEM